MRTRVLKNVGTDSRVVIVLGTSQWIPFSALPEFAAGLFSAADVTNMSHEFAWGRACRQTYGFTPELPASCAELFCKSLYSSQATLWDILCYLRGCCSEGFRTMHVSSPVGVGKTSAVLALYIAHRVVGGHGNFLVLSASCLLYTSPSPRDS